MSRTQLISIAKISVLNVSSLVPKKIEKDMDNKQSLPTKQPTANSLPANLPSKARF
jgi:hypothetical protein